MTLVCAHRGASAELPDNSMAAFEAAVVCGADMIETDVRRGPDGALVLAHDAVDALAPDAVRLEGLLSLAEGRIGLDLELKAPGLERDLLQMLGTFRGSVVVSSFDPSLIDAVKRSDGGVRTGLLVEQPVLDEPVQLAGRLGASVLIADDPLVGPELCERALRGGLELWAFTVNDEDRLLELIEQPGVTGVITDVPELALDLRRATRIR